MGFKITPIINVNSIEDTLPFWESNLGYEVTVRVPSHDNRLGFVILVKGDTEIMLQTKRSIEEDLHGHPEIANSEILLYADVDSIESVEKALLKENVLVPKRKTFYGSLEIWAKDSSGKIIGFAQKC
jgi:uncharacterized glyoxalase superfamily protein PhnB